MARDVLMERQTYRNQTYKGKIQAAALGSHGARCPNGAACSTGRNLAGTQHRCGHRGMERSTHPTPQGVARGEQLLGRVETMLDESIVQKLCRIRVHATERVEGKRNEVKVVLVTDLLVRVDVVVVEHD